MDKKIVETEKKSLGFESKWAIVLSISGGKDVEARAYRLTKKRVLIGSALSSDIQIDNPSVSNIHAVLEIEDSGEIRLYDMASEHGITVNGKKILTEELRDQDELKIGSIAVKLRKVAIQEPVITPDPVVTVKADAPAPTRAKTGVQLDAKEDFSPLILEDERNVIEIFDYPAHEELGLQVVMHWGDVILDVIHVPEGETIVIGETSGVNFLVPGLHSNLPLITSEPGGVVIQFTKDMSGVVRSGHKIIDLVSIGALRAVLKKDDLAKIQYKDISFFVNYSPLPPHLRRQRIFERDPMYTRMWTTSIAITLLILFLIWMSPRPKPLEIDELPPRVATMIFKLPTPIVKPTPNELPVEVKKTPEPIVSKKVENTKTLPKEVKKTPVETKLKAQTTPTDKKVEKAVVQKKGSTGERAGDSGEGTRAGGKEGRKGAPGKTKSTVAQNESRGNPNVNGGQKSDSGKGKGNVESLFGDLQGTITESLAASGKGAKAAGARLRGYGGFTTEGMGGLGNLGDGPGGGGAKSQDLSQGLGTKGLGEGASGKGLGAIGKGGNLLGTGYGRPTVEVGNGGDTVILGGLDKDIIRDTINRYMNQIRYCYEKELDVNPKIKGRIATRFVISGTGRVTEAGVEASNMGNANVETCLVAVIKKIQFPEPVGGGTVDVRYPFTFTPSVPAN